MATKAMVLCGHGSRHPDGVEGFLALVAKFKQRHPGKTIEAGFLELSAPTLAEAVGKLYAQGIRDIVAVPAFLFTGIHLRQDIPLLLKQLMEKHHGLRIRMASCIGVCDELVELACQKIAVAEGKFPKFDRGQSLLFGIGVGASVPEANGDIAKLKQLISEKSGFAYSLLGFTSPVAKPSVTESARILSYLPHKIVVVLPILLFNGAYLETAIATLEDTAREAGKTLVVCDPFQSDALILAAMERRMDEVLDGTVDLAQTVTRENTGKAVHGHS